MNNTQWDNCQSVPIKLTENEYQDPVDDEIERLRKAKEMQTQMKQYQAAVISHNKKIERKKQQIINEILPKSKGLQLAYDYDGSYIVAKQKYDSRFTHSQPNVHISEVNTVFQPQPPQTAKVVEHVNINKKELTKPHKAVTQPPQTIHSETNVKPFQNFVPNQGVRLIYQDVNQEEVIEHQEPKKWNNRMTKKEFEDLQQKQSGGQRLSLQQAITSNLVEKQYKEPIKQQQKDFVKPTQQQDVKMLPTITSPKANVGRSNTIKVANVQLLSQLLE